MVKREVFEWVKSSRKTIEVRRGNARRGEEAVFQCGHNVLRLAITKKETGKLAELLRANNYKSIIPVANSREEAIGYFQSLYGDIKGIFTAYYLQPLRE